MKFEKNGNRTKGTHYLVPVKQMTIDVEYKGQAFVSDGCYIEMCECHPDRKSTRYIEVENGDYFESEEIHDFEIEE